MVIADNHRAPRARSRRLLAPGSRPPRRDRSGRAGTDGRRPDLDPLNNVSYGLPASARAGDDGTVVCMETTSLPTIRVATSADWHAGYEAYKATTPAGLNQRGVDIVKAMSQVVEDIVAWDPELVLLPGDLTHTPTVPMRYMDAVRRQLVKLAACRPDGTRRQVVVLSGNHDQPRQLTELNFLELFRGLPGIHVVCTRYELVEFPDSGTSAGRPDSLAKVIVHALPHDQLARVEWDAVRPIDEHINILSAHGVCGGSELYTRSIGREFSIPTDVLHRAWEYGALGHWHKRCMVTDRVGYAGSPENIGFSDLRDNGDRRGYVRAVLTPGMDPVVTNVDLPLRRMLRLPEVNASGMKPDEIADAITAQAKDADLRGAVVWQIVNNVTSDTWALVDRTLARKAADSALHYELTARRTGATSSTEARPDPDEARMADVVALLESEGARLLGPDAPSAVSLAKDLVTAQLEVAGKEQAADEVAVLSASAATASGSTVLTLDDQLGTEDAA
jgi:DNA repair exonuclease SbcCD nuclease subunit